MVQYFRQSNGHQRPLRYLASSSRVSFRISQMFYHKDFQNPSRSKLRVFWSCILFCLFSVNLNAQLDIWGNVGMNYSTINTPNNEAFEITPKYGINIGVGFPYSFNKHFSIEPEANIAQKGARLVGIIPNASAFFDDYNMKLTYLEIPISLKTKIDYKNIACFFKAGVYFGVNIWTNSVQKSLDVVGHWRAPNFDRPFDYGLHGGIGFELNKKFSIQSRLYYGLNNLTNFYGPPNEYYSNFVINMSVGYKFQKTSHNN